MGRGGGGRGTGLIGEYFTSSILGPIFRPQHWKKVLKCKMAEHGNADLRYSGG